MGETGASEAGNAAMAEYWSGPGGARWLAHEALIERQTAAVTDRLLAAAEPRPGQRVLEVGCGTGTLAARIAGAIVPGGRLLAVDISAPLLALAERNAPAVEFRLGDAQEMALPHGAHDLAISRFGVMFFADPRAAFANLRSSLRPGGRLCFACWAPTAASPFWSVPMGAATARLGPPDPQPEGAPGPLALADADRTRAILAAAGFAQVSVATELVAMGPVGLDEASLMAVTMGPAGRLITAREADADAVAAIRAEVARGFARYAEPGGVSVPALIHIVTGVNPGG